MRTVVDRSLRRRLALFVGACGGVFALALALGSGGLDAALIGELRLPRVLAAAGVGALLALSGLAMQALLRNPLADPYVLGTSGGASVGALLALLAGAGLWVGAGLGALVASVLLLLLARAALLSNDDASPRLILIGAMLAAVTGACATLLLTVVPDARLRGALFWLVGDLSGATRGGWCLLVAACLVLYFVWRDRRIARLLLGSESAWLMGEPVERLRAELLVVASVGAGLAVATAGAIGFVGLVVPQVLRLAGVARPRLLAACSALGGAALLVLADLVSRIVWMPLELPVGAVMALIGAPLFIVFLRRGGDLGFNHRLLEDPADATVSSSEANAVSHAPVATGRTSLPLEWASGAQARAPMIEVRDLTVSAGRRELVRKLSWAVQQGECWAIIGRNGVGKTRLLRALAGLDEDSRDGAVRWQGRDVRRWPAHEAASLRALMPQQVQDRFSMAVGRLLALSSGTSEAFEARQDELWSGLAQQLGIDGLLSQDVLTLSGGQRQRVAIAQTLVQGAPLMLLDEPVSFQDPARQWALGRLLRQAAVGGDRAIVLTAHDLNWVATVATHVLALLPDGGVLSGPVDAMIEPTVLSRVYGCSWTRAGALVMPERRA